MSRSNILDDYQVVGIPVEMQEAFDKLQEQAWTIFCTTYKDALISAMKHLDRHGNEATFHPWFVIGQVIQYWTPEAVSTQCLLMWERRCLDELVRGGIIERMGPANYSGVAPKYRLI